MSPTQCRAARGLLDWTQDGLASKARVGLSTVKDFEAGRREPRAASMESMRRALERGGVEFIEAGETSEGAGSGVRLRKGKG